MEVTSVHVIEDNQENVGFDVIPAVAPLLPRQAIPNTPQIDALRLRRDTVRASMIAPVQTTVKLLTAGAFVPDGASITNSTLTQAINQEGIIQIVHRQAYIGAVSPNNRMPEIISSSLYPHYEWDSIYTNDGTSIANTPYKSLHKIQVRNNSGSTQRIIFEILVRSIVNRSDNGISQ